MKNKKNVQTKFKDRYVLETGYPWAFGTSPYRSVGVGKRVNSSEWLDLDFPKELWGKDCPRYHLVLERVK